MTVFDVPTRSSRSAGPARDGTPAQLRDLMGTDFEFSAQQFAAVSAPLEPGVVLAGAGSGKTEVVARRIAQLLTPADGSALHPRQIIAFTFTEKAAAELKERIVARVREQLGEIPGMAEMYVGTMHGYCLDLLQRLVPDTFKFSVLSDITARLLVDRNSRKSGLTACPTSLASTPHLRRFLHSKLYPGSFVPRATVIETGRSRCSTGDSAGWVRQFAPWSLGWAPVPWAVHVVVVGAAVVAVSWVREARPV